MGFDCFDAEQRRRPASSVGDGLLFDNVASGELRREPGRDRAMVVMHRSALNALAAGVPMRRSGDELTVGTSAEPAGRAVVLAEPPGRGNCRRAGRAAQLYLQQLADGLRTRTRCGR
ncbi:MAG: hypothetical protein H6703_14785 [Myxococcales bacterium]|nr:hypothetical protein [Myxococcales bacterium]